METYKGVLGTVFVRRNDVEWKIKDFLSFSTEDEYYNSPDFSVSGIKWFMRIYPNGRTSDNSTGWVSLYLRKHHDDESVSPVGANFWLYSVPWCHKKGHGEITWVYKDNEGYGYPKFLKRSKLERIRNYMLHPTDWELHCSLQVTTDLRSPSGLDDLSRDFTEMFSSRRGCDVILRVKEKEFPIHKYVLSARSSVFASMFEVDMKEKRMELVEIEDCDPWIFWKFLIYLYSGKAHILPDEGPELYKIADKYDVKDLKSHCLVLILANISVENFMDAFTFGRQFRSHEVNIKTQEFFNKNFQKIVQSDKWKAFLKENTSVANELLEGMAKKLSKTSRNRIEASDAGASALSGTF